MAYRVSLSLSLATLALWAWAASAEVVTYPIPEGEVPSTDFEVWVEGRKVDVYTARTLDPPFAGKQWDYGGPYSFASFDMSGEVTVRIRSKRSLRQTVVRPASAGVTPQFDDDHALTIRLDRPRKLSIEPDGRKGPLLLFANPMEEDPPKAGTEGVVYFGPGIHKPGKIEIGSGQTLYLAGGAVVKGGVLAEGDGIKICGRGILDGSDWEWRKGPTPNVVAIHGSNIEVTGITIRGASHWTIVPRHSRHVTIRNVKLCNSRVQNDDGINPCNSQDVLITDCFIRSDDDCVALKGLTFEEGVNSNVERITVENSILWCDRARIFLLGHESRAEWMRHITLRNLDIIHFTMTPFLFEPGEDMRLQQVTVRQVRLHGEGQRELIRLRPVVNQYMRKKVPGYVADVRFEEVTLTGAPGEYLVQLAGADAEHNVKDVTFKNVRIGDRPLAADSANVQKGEQVEGVKFEK
ncbi:MAG: glycosyl hydrolase family 28 protein [Thermoguttaceae bacterium]